MLIEQPPRYIAVFHEAISHAGDTGHWTTSPGWKVVDLENPHRVPIWFNTKPEALSYIAQKERNLV